jgi:hypothetical protein
MVSYQKTEEEYDMKKRSKLAFAAALLAAAASFAGAPLKGVDVKLGKNPGGTAAARTGQSTATTATTDADGKAAFGTLEKGSYTLTLPPRDPRGGDVCTVTLAGAVGGPITRDWSGRTAETIAFDTDGAQPVSVTIVKSKSNISNN